MNSQNFKVYNLVLEELLNNVLLNENNGCGGEEEIEIIDLTNNISNTLLSSPTTNKSYMFINNNTLSDPDTTSRTIIFTDGFPIGKTISFSRIVGTTINNAASVYVVSQPPGPPIDCGLNIITNVNPVLNVMDSLIVNVNNNGTLTKIGGNKSIL